MLHLGDNFKWKRWFEEAVRVEGTTDKNRSTLHRMKWYEWKRSASYVVKSAEVFMPQISNIVCSVFYNGIGHIDSVYESTTWW